MTKDEMKALLVLVDVANKDLVASESPNPYISRAREFDKGKWSVEISRGLFHHDDLLAFTEYCIRLHLYFSMVALQNGVIIMTIQ